MISVTDEVLNGEPTYTITYSDSTTSSGVKIDLDTQVVTEGTALNKALFDSIDNDIQARLLISNKATNSEAKAGTNDTKYMTPSKVQSKLQSLITNNTITNTSGSSTTSTLFDGSSISTPQEISLELGINAGTGSNNVSIVLNGTGIQSASGSSATSSSTTLELKFYQTSRSSARIVFNTFTNTFHIEQSRFNSTGSRIENTISGVFTTLTSITAVCPSQNQVRVDYSIHFSDKNPNA